MGFGEKNSWWGGKGPRKAPHNGVDLRYYRTPDRKEHRLGQGTRVPAPFDGRVVSIIKDYIGKSVFLLHDIEMDGMRLVSAIGHIAPQGMLRPGVVVKAGAILGTVAGVKNDAPVKPHIHLTLALIRPDIPPEKIDWAVLDGGGEGVRLLDPREHF
jgi:murein DD-endopeptidase MepM/ murein hydrolase activator NlpD